MATNLGKGGAPLGDRRRNTKMRVIIGATIAIVVIVGLSGAAYFLMHQSAPIEWHLVQTFTGAACDGVLTCRTPSFEVTSGQWKVSWDINATKTFQVDVYIGTPSSVAPVQNGWIRGDLKGELLSPVGAGTWTVFFTAPNSGDLGTIRTWVITIWAH